MDILLKGKEGCVNVEFHKQALSKSHLDRDFEYVVQCYLFYDRIIDQKIIVMDKDRKSIEKIQIMPDLEYKAKYYFIPDIDGATILNNIKNKTKINQELDEYEQYVFSILPFTSHGHYDEEQLVKELCYLTPKINIPEKNRESIALCQCIQIELFVNDEELENELMDVIAMTSSCIERRENKLKNALKKAQKEAEEKVHQAELKAEQAEEKAQKEAEEKVHQAELKAEQDKQNILKEIVDNVDENGKLNPKTLEKILAITSKI